MSMPIFESAAGPNTGAQFPSTLWSVVRSAQDGQSTVALAARIRLQVTIGEPDEMVSRHPSE